MIDNILNTISDVEKHEKKIKLPIDFTTETGYTSVSFSIDNVVKKVKVIKIKSTGVKINKSSLF